ncbi:chitin deacetylase [Tulasnella sp. 424]|nr:chitin deacetylase [Tulasnella sp. 424]KAG8974626.1 chitin deacetylase [Tulasnella sp. 425]
MKVAVSLIALSAASIVVAHGGSGSVAQRHKEYVKRREAVYGRQAPAPASASGAAASGAATTTAAAQPAVTTPTVAGTIIPPLDQITSGAPIQTPLTIFTTYAAGASAPYSGAPALPTIAIVPTSYPALDTVPDVNSAQVKKWLSEIDLSKVPNLSKTVDGSCGSDAAAAADTTRCWWTCGGCTRETDVVSCPKKLDWGVSFDDGPSPYTPKLVNYLHEKNLQATFFVVGSRVISRPDMLQAEYMLGHEISIHTWSHTPLTTLTNEQIVAELGWTRQAIKDVIGVSPRTMRPPYGDIDDRVRAVCAAMGLTPIIWTGVGEQEFDTDDWKIAGGTATGTSSFAAWKQIVTQADTLNTGFIVLEHDLYQQSVDMAVGYIIPDALSHTPAFSLKPIIECLNQPASNAYAELFSNSTSSSATGTASGGSTKTGTGSSATGTGAASNTNAAVTGRGISVVAGLVGIVAASFMW